MAAPVSAGPSAGAAAGAGAGEAAAEAEKPKEKTMFTVTLTKIDAAQKAKAIKEVKAIQPTMNLVEVGDRSLCAIDGSANLFGMYFRQRSSSRTCQTSSRRT